MSSTYDLSAVEAGDHARALIDLSLDLLLVFDAGTGRIRHANRAVGETLGWPPEVLRSTPFEAFVHPEDAEATLAAASALRDGSRVVVGFENRWRHADGSFRRLLWSARQVDDAWYAVAKDVTDLRARESAAAAQLRSSERLHRTLAANLPDCSVFLLDRDLRILLADGEAVRAVPWFAEDLFVGRLLTELHEVPEDVLETSLRTYRAALSGERGRFEFLSDGSSWSVDAVPVPGDDGAVCGILAVVRDVTGRRRADEERTRRLEQQATVAALSQLALGGRDTGELLAEVVRHTRSASSSVATILRCDPQRGGFEILAAAGAQAPIGAATECVVADRTIEAWSPLVVEDWLEETGLAYPPQLEEWGIRSTITVPLGRQEEPFGVLSIHDVPARAFGEDDQAFLSSVGAVVTVAIERRREELAMQHAALHDPLTGLPNRTLVLERLAHALEERRSRGTCVAVLALDLDRFKIINDSRGHGEGDEVLLALAARLSAVVRDGDTVGRVGGDEFLVVCGDLESRGAAIEVADRIAEAISRPLRTPNGEYVCATSIGLRYAADGDSPQSLMRDADAAMYRAKSAGGGRLALFDEELHAECLERIQLETDLRQAIDRREIEVWYQPIHDLRSGLIAGAEALARWRHPQRGYVGPDVFIPIAEDTGLIRALGAGVLDDACRAAARWQHLTDRPFEIAVNVSGRQLTHLDFVDFAADTARRHGLQEGSLTLEITESVLMRDADRPEQIVAALRERGIGVALDDFGTGYSSLSLLTGLMVDVLKIDRSFVSRLTTTAQIRPVVRAMVEMARALGLTVVAEGVETPEELEALGALGCERAQGYLLGRPVPADELSRALGASQAPPRVRAA